MDPLTRALAGLLRRWVRVLPAGRRQWGAAVSAEADEVPAGWPRLWWLAGGLWLVAREAGMARRIGYRLGVAAVAVAAAGVVWVGWRGASANPETPFDRARVIVLVAALAGLPWVARRRGVFGPAGDSIAARVVRVSGCAAVCAVVLGIARVDQFAGGAFAGPASAGAFGWAREAVDLGLIAAFMAVILVVTARRPPIDPAAVGVCAPIAGLFVFAFAPVQLLITVYAAGILAVTARWSPLAPATLAIGAGAGAGAGLIVYALTAAGGPHLAPWLVLPVVGLGAPAAAGLAAALRTSGPDSPAALRQARVQQGAAAGAMTGGAAALLINILTLNTMVHNPAELAWLSALVLGPLFGVAAGAVSGAVGADRRREPRPEGSWSGGFFVFHS